MAISFSLRSSNKKKPVTIYLRLRKTGISWYFSTPYSIMVNQWNAKRGMPYPGRNVAEQSELKSLIGKLQNLEKAITLYTERCDLKKRSYTRENIEEIINDIEKEHTSIQKEVPFQIIEYLDFLIKAMENGDFRSQQSNYDEHTIKVWKNFRDIYALFENYYESKTNRILDWNTIDKTVYDSFIAYCENRGYMTKSINKLLICFKAAINYSSEYHNLHQNTSCLKYFNKLRVIKGSTQTKVYLTTEELTGLYFMPLEPGSLKDKVRDIFLIGCYIGQRVSDYSKLKPENFTTTSRGTKVVCILQEKTNNYVMVPVLTDKLVTLVEKYNYNLPCISEVIINRYIKQICKDLSKTVPSLSEMIITPLTMREVKAEQEGKLTFQRNESGHVIKPKYQLISTHTARRSTITNLYKFNLFNTYQLMSISGHKSEGTFWEYLSQSTEEIAQEIAQVRENLKENKNISNGDLF